MARRAFDQRESGGRRTIASGGHSLRVRNASRPEGYVHRPQPGAVGVAHLAMVRFDVASRPGVFQLANRWVEDLFCGAVLRRGADFAVGRAIYCRPRFLELAM